jgi:hypothetical protein
MTTYQLSGCTLRNLTALVATALLWGIAAQAQSAPTAGTHPNVLDCTNAVHPVSVRANQYLLLMFFSDNDDGRASVKAAFNADWKQDGTVKRGCIADPNPDRDSTRLIAVDGSCPTDCTQPKVKTLDQYTPGDPLLRSDPNLGWGIFFADSTGNYEAATNDEYTSFRAFQIVARDSCHAGHILNSLNLSAANYRGYLGHIMIGRAPPKPANGTGSKVTCAPWKAPDAVRE